jgi:hypothetical protein
MRARAHGHIMRAAAFGTSETFVNKFCNAKFQTLEKFETQNRYISGFDIPTDVCYFYEYAGEPRENLYFAIG